MEVVEDRSVGSKGQPGAGTAVKGGEEVVGKQKTLKKQPTAKVQQVKVDEKEERAKKMLFEEG